MSAWLLPVIPLDPGALSAGAAALADPQPKVTWALNVPGGWAARINIDFGGDRPIDTLGLLFHNGAIGGSMSIFGRTAAEGDFANLGGGESAENLLSPGQPWRAEPTITTATRFHGIATFTQASVRYVRLILYWPGPVDMRPFRAGVLAVGKRFQPGGLLGGLDWGAGRKVNDLSNVRILPGGERGRWRAPKLPEVRGSWSHLTDAELREFWSIVNEVGESEPVLLVETPDTGGAVGAHERIHYGTLVGLDFYERRQTDKSRAEVRLQHWL
ncbi:MAG: hypothetical protein KGZ61_05160 [Sandarakinorhabdus sp.]|nr:hypothetical protein [Sandarakinorhabdus sp.]